MPGFLLLEVPEPLIRSWDVFCRVVDNFGDAGIAWRLARQLVNEQGGAVRLWIDDFAVLHALWPEVDPAAAWQSVAGVEVRRWDGEASSAEPRQVVIDLFGCGIPEPFVAAMARREPRALWVTVEHLSAEPWVRTHHGLPSPHPRWPIPRYFFFPGFTADTGGLPAESDLAARRDAFGPEERARFWESLGYAAPPGETTVISLFAYDHAPLPALLSSWEEGADTVVLAVPQGAAATAVREWLGAGDPDTGRVINRGRLEVRFVPFLDQRRYDELLWACDCNFVRGEDSFVRAQWAAKPMVWHIYRQQEGAHWPKLEAFLDLYTAGMPAAAGRAVRELWRAWNAESGRARLSETWNAFRMHRLALGRHARDWAAELAKVGNMAHRLAQFCSDRLKSATF
jgi:uncharacterized repeat protein (TIGR03837 family)